MANDGGEKPKASLDVSIGKEINAALGDVIRGLLKKPADEAGNLLAAGIGILGDRVKRKRELNAQLGMDEVRKKLDADGIDIKDITPPKEEELHLLLNGMSLSDDENVRDMWAGLFAKALEPNSDVTAERPFISVLESLSPMDAKVIDLLAFIQRTENELKAQAKQFTPKDFANITAEEKEEIDKLKHKNSILQKTAITSIKEKADEYGLVEIEISSWADNLMRQGLIERTPIKHLGHSSSFAPSIRNDEDMLRAFANLHKQLKEMEQVTVRKASPPERLFSQHMFGPQLNFEVQLTEFGKRFSSACGID